MTTRCLLVDDEELARLQLARLLAAHSEIQIVGEAANGLEALEAINELQPDVLFLDIEMPGLNGFDMLAELRQAPLVIFTTAYDEYAIRAFDANALDYLLKPIQPARLAQALEKIRSYREKPRAEYHSSLQNALTTLRPRSPAKLVGRRGRRLVLLSPSEVLYAEIEDKLVFLYTQTDRFVSDRSIAELDDLLSANGFFRVSRAAVVNLEHARELLPCSSGTWRLKLSSNAEVYVGRERFRSLKERIS